MEFPGTSAVQEAVSARRSAVWRLLLAGEDSQDELRAHLQQSLAQFGRLLALTFGLFFAWRIAHAVWASDGVSRDCTARTQGRAE